MVTQPGKLSPSRFLSISPDGRFLLFDDVSDDKKNEDSATVVFDVTTGEARVFTLGSPNARAAFSSDSRFLDYYENPPEGVRFWRQPLDGKGERKLLFEIPRTRIEDFDWSPDGKTLAIARGRQENDAILLTGF
jgi:Tol biopolymer transport system component